MPEEPIGEREFLETLIARVAALGVVSASETRALIDVLEKIANQVGVTQIEGLPIKRAYFEYLQVRLQEQLELMENTSPAIAARLSADLDEMRRKVEGDFGK